MDCTTEEISETLHTSRGVVNDKMCAKQSSGRSSILNYFFTNVENFEKNSRCFDFYIGNSTGYAFIYYNKFFV